jgi:hypothetical protein
MARNFEAVKRAAYNLVVNHRDFKLIPLKDSVQVQNRKYYPDKLDDLKKELNEALDRWDIRAVGSLIDVLPTNRPGVAGWIRRKQFVIDYNGRDELDLIRIDNLNN